MKMLINPLEMLTIELIEAGQKLISSYNRKRKYLLKDFIWGIARNYITVSNKNLSSCQKKKRWQITIAVAGLDRGKQLLLRVSSRTIFFKIEVFV